MPTCAWPECEVEALLSVYEGGQKYQRKYCDEHLRTAARKTGGSHGSGQDRVYDRGYVRIRKEVDGRTVWVAEHREIMSQMIGRELRPEEQVLHKNGIKDDNRPENLILRTTISPGDFECGHCGQNPFSTVSQAF